MSVLEKEENSMNTGDNVAYVASTSGDKDKVAEAYDYVVTTEGNDIIRHMGLSHISSAVLIFVIDYPLHWHFMSP